jgi:hypothetical protein
MVDANGSVNLAGVYFQLRSVVEKIETLLGAGGGVEDFAGSGGVSGVVKVDASLAGGIAFGDELKAIGGLAAQTGGLRGNDDALVVVVDDFGFDVGHGAVLDGGSQHGGVVFHAETNEGGDGFVARGVSGSGAFLDPVTGNGYGALHVVNGFGVLGVQQRRQDYVCRTKRSTKEQSMREWMQDNGSRKNLLRR